jgi:hypothetical protein
MPIRWTFPFIALLLCSTAWAQAPDDERAIRARWYTLPESCAPDSWSRLPGDRNRQHPPAQKRSSAASITGAQETTSAATAGGIDPRSYDTPPQKILTADEWVARLACGQGVRGIEPTYGNVLWGEIGRGYERTRYQQDSRPVLLRAVREGTGDEPHRVLYRAMLLHQCFAQTEYDAKWDYMRYVYCVDATAGAPTPQAVVSAAATVFGQDEWNRANVRSLYQRALAARDQVVEVFTKQEANYPLMKSVLRDSAAAAVARFRARHARYADIYKIVDPISQRKAAQISRRDSAAAAMVLSMSPSLWASETKAASNCEGAR